jgi:hypothetical protein
LNDDKKAVIVSGSADRATAKTLESEIGSHSRYSNRAGYPTPDGPPPFVLAALLG